MSGPNDFFTADHHRCDALWAAVEAAADQGDAAGARAAWTTFAEAMERHFRMEEEVLFVAFEQATGMFRGPTSMMRAEHAQMRGLMAQMAEAAAAGDLGELTDAGDTLMMVIQQHNAKEEGILYPMCDQALAAGWPGLAEALSRV